MSHSSVRLGRVQYCDAGTTRLGMEVLSMVGPQLPAEAQLLYGRWVLRYPFSHGGAECGDCGERTRWLMVESKSPLGYLRSWFWCGVCDIGG